MTSSASSASSLRDLAAHVREAYRIDLAARYLGHPLPHPIGKASGQLSLNLEQVETDRAAGLAFVVLKTVIAEDPAGDPLHGGVGDPRDQDEGRAAAVGERPAGLDRNLEGSGLGPDLRGLSRAGSRGGRSHPSRGDRGRPFGQVPPPPAGGAVSRYGVRPYDRAAGPRVGQRTAPSGEGFLTYSCRRQPGPGAVADSPLAPRGSGTDPCNRSIRPSGWRSS